METNKEMLDIFKDLQEQSQKAYGKDLTKNDLERMMHARVMHAAKNNEPLDDKLFKELQSYCNLIKLFDIVK